MPAINTTSVLNPSGTPTISAMKVESVAPVEQIKVPTWKEAFDDPIARNADLAANNARKLKAEQMTRQLRNDEAFNTMPAMDQEELMAFQKRFGGIPRNSAGQYDIEQVRAQNAENYELGRADARVAAAMTGKKATEEVMRNPKTGKWEKYHVLTDLITNEVTHIPTGVPAADPTLVGGRVPGAMTAVQIAEAQQQISDTAGQIAGITRIRDLVNGGRNVVGPAIGSVGNVAAGIGAFFGQDASQALINDQRELEIFKNEEAMGKVQFLKGALSERELLFLKATIPKITDDEALWNRWLDNTEKAYRIREKRLRGILNGTVDPTAPIPDTGIGLKPDGTPEPIPDRSKESKPAGGLKNAPPVRNAEEEALHSRMYPKGRTPPVPGETVRADGTKVYINPAYANNVMPYGPGNPTSRGPYAFPDRVKKSPPAVGPGPVVQPIAQAPIIPTRGAVFSPVPVR